MDIAILLIVLSNVFLSYLHSRDKKIRQFQKKTAISAKLKAVLAFKNYITRQMIIINLIGLVFCPTAAIWHRVGFTAWNNYAGLMLALLALLLRQWSYKALSVNWSDKVARPGQLIKTGPYRWIRHPVYSSYLLMNVGAFLATGSVTLISLGLIFFSADVIRSGAEETLLHQGFGDEFREYAKTTGRFVPLAISYAASGLLTLAFLLLFITGAADETRVLLGMDSFTVEPTCRLLNNLFQAIGPSL